MPDSIPMYIGTYTQRGSQGVYLSALNTAQPALAPPQLIAKIEHPTWLTQHPHLPVLYVASTVDEYEGEATGSVTAYAIDPDDHALHFLNRFESHGTRPCYMSVDATGSCLLVANFGSGTAAVLPIQFDGSLSPASDVQRFEGSSVHPVRQLGPHAHCIVVHPNNRFVITVDLGSDCIWTHWLDHEACRLLSTKQRSLTLPAGTGPRHLVLDSGNNTAYLNSELSNTVHTLAVDPKGGSLTVIRSNSTLPEDFSGRSAGGDLHLSPDGQFLYSSNRGHESLVIFRRETGQLEPVGYAPVLGQSPRHFIITSDGRFLILANQGSDQVILFQRNMADGSLLKLDELQVPAASCIRLLNIP